MLDYSTLSPVQIKTLQQALTPRLNKYIPITPTAKQAAAMLMNDERELLYGGAAGGGKSIFLLASALQYVDIPNYAAILFRKTFSDLMLPGALIPVSQQWLAPWLDKGVVQWKDKDKKYIFHESGATLSFGYMENAGDHFRYQGAEFQFVGFDEVSHIAPVSYRYLFSRLRRKADMRIPPRFRATANPGGQYGEYYYERFFVDNIDETTGKKKRVFLQAGLRDNPHVDAVSYREALAELDPITRAQLEDGNWEIRPHGDLFDKSWLLTIDHAGIPQHTRWVRFWDLAAIDPKLRSKHSDKREPDWTVGFKLGYANGCYYIGDIVKAQKSPGDVEQIIYNTAVADGHRCAIRMEEEGGSSGIANTQRYSRYVLPGFNFTGVKPIKNKVERARPVAAACQVGNVFVSNRCRNLLDFYAQIDAFPNGAKDDIVDAFSGAFAYFTPSIGRVTAPDATILQQKRRIETLNDGEGSIYIPRGSYWHNPMSNY